MDQRDPQWMFFVWDLVARSPVLVVLFIGMILALVSWHKGSGRAMLTCIACFMLLLSNCVFPAMFHFLTPWMRQNAPLGEEFNRMNWTNRMIFMSWSVTTAVCLGALIYAVFAGRAKASSQENNSWDDEDDAPIRPNVAEPDERIKAS